MRGYVIIRTVLPVRQYLYELVRCSDGAIVALSQTTNDPICAPLWMRQQQARLNTKAVMDEIAP